MSLARMLAQSEGLVTEPKPKPQDEQAAVSDEDKNNTNSHQEPHEQAVSPLTNFSDKIRVKLVEKVGETMTDTNFDENEASQAELRRKVTQELSNLITADKIPLNDEERQRIISEVTNDVLGLGPLEALLEDSTVSEIMVNGPDTIYVERKGQIVLSDITFRSEGQLRQIIDKIVSSIGRRVDESSPLVDARLQDGSRVNAVIPPLAVDGSSLTIRKFSKEGMTATDLVEKKALTPQSLNFLKAAIQGRLNILVSGGTGTGKTTFLNILSSFIQEGDRIVTIEDAVELQLRQRHVIRLETRPPNIEGKGEITIRDLVKNSLRMRPDRIIVGECRGSEALDMLQAMNTGHEGSLTTLHANTPRDALGRMETMVLMAGFDLPARAIKEQTASAVDLICQLERLRTGHRKVSSITEVVGLEGDQVTLNELYYLDHENPDRDGIPVLRATGVRPQNAEKMVKNGIVMDGSWFETNVTFEV